MTVERIPIINGADIFTLDASSKPSDQARLLLASIRKYISSTASARGIVQYLKWSNQCVRYYCNMVHPSPLQNLAA